MATLNQKFTCSLSCESFTNRGEQALTFSSLQRIFELLGDNKDETFIKKDVEIGTTAWVNSIAQWKGKDIDFEGELKNGQIPNYLKVLDNCRKVIQENKKKYSDIPKGISEEELLALSLYTNSDVANKLAFALRAEGPWSENAKKIFQW